MCVNHRNTCSPLRRRRRVQLNATSEMIPITWPEFANMHPFVPADQAAGYTEMIHDLSAMLAKITGFTAVSVQPNSGAQVRRARVGARGGRGARAEPCLRARAGRVCGAVRDPGVPRRGGALGAQGVPHPAERARHEPRERCDRRHGGKRA